ncbi:hypothetical protein ACFQ69_36830 [Streptomyces sp. NPDC056470]|uniref:hypothetical protein n=1 Tax=Streptomyces sp. NPDC056470 TaxID=3345831 RepID=UPI003696D730
MQELQGLQDALSVCKDSDLDRVRDLLHTAGVMTGVWLDDIACRFADTDHDADELFARAWQFVDDLELTPGGFLTKEDAELFATLRGSAASMLARLWFTGYLLGPVPEDAWPHEELATLLLRALEHHVDARALTEALDHQAAAHALAEVLDHQHDPSHDETPSSKVTEDEQGETETP